MSDDPTLGDFRDEFAGKLGMVEEFPNVPTDGPGSVGATKIIDSQELLRLDARPHSARRRPRVPHGAAG